jgi:RNA polymerase sigma factor (sigma-70 family)
MPDEQIRQRTGRTLVAVVCRAVCAAGAEVRPARAGLRYGGKQMTKRERVALDEALDGLPDRLRLVIELRFLAEPRWTMQRLGDRLGLSYQRVGQLQYRAL